MHNTAVSHTLSNDLYYFIVKGTNLSKYLNQDSSNVESYFAVSCIRIIDKKDNE